MASCGHWGVLGPTGPLKRFFCGGGSCTRPECQKLFWSHRVALLTALIGEHGLTRFFTLTLDREAVRGDPWDYIHSPWSKLRKRLNRRYAFNFVAVLEAHKDKAYPHIHGFTNVWLAQRDWSAHWAGCGGGPIVWVEKVKDKALSTYVSKQIEVARYVGKDNLRKAYEQRGRHRTLWRSKGLKAKFELTTEPGWSIVKEHVFKEDGTMYSYWQRQEDKRCQSGTPKGRLGVNMQGLT